MKEPARPSADHNGAAELAEPRVLNDAAIDAATLKELRASYRELRAAYVALHERHHERITDALADRKTKRFGEFDPTQVKRMIEAHRARAKYPD